ncbi:hypothetical protein [Tateyamaria sp.]|uniref:hypothetical protein n=1 Tax=Tateyamaria sp. TaxID=1929288 RepID=UPI003B21931B
MQEYNEAEVRFHFIDPLIRKLGYPGDEEVFFKLEEKLEYPYFHIGHKSAKKDQPLGFPDYRAGLKGRRGSFIVEAKSQKAGLTLADVEQAHSYAAHAQVGANYFVLCDGVRLAVYETLSGPTHSPLVEMPVEDIEDKYHEIENILSPSRLAENCHVEYDTGQKLCDGLGSAVKIRAGIYDMQAWDYRILVGGNDVTEMLKATVPEVAQIDKDMAMMQEDFELRVGDGIAERDQQGRIQAQVSFVGVTKNNAEVMRLLGIKSMKFATDADFVSVDPNEPTVFESTAEFSVERGTMLPPLFGAAVPADVDTSGDMFVAARMHKAEKTIVGEYLVTADYWFDVPGFGKMKAELDVAGRFSLELDV